MGTARTGGVGDAELVGVEQQGGGIGNLKCLLLLVQSKLFRRDGVDQSVAKRLRQGSVLSVRRLHLVGMGIEVFCCFLVVVKLEHQSVVTQRQKDFGLEGKYLVLGEGIVPLFHQVLDLFHPLRETGTSHFEKRPRSGMVLLAAQLLEALLVLLKGVERTIDKGVDPHDKIGIDLNLMKLFSKRLVAISAVFFVEVGKTVG